jgi:hypothetical protein
MTTRKQRKALGLREDETRQRAYHTARDLVLSIVGGQPTLAAPYGVGVVLDPGEQVWAECSVRFLQEVVTSVEQTVPPARRWLVTSNRIVGRLGDDHLYGWRWEQMRGCRVDLSVPTELVAVDLDNGSILEWTGGGVAPLAVVAVARLYGQGALIDHPGLAAIRLADRVATQNRRRQVALPSSSLSSIRFQQWA